MKKSLYQPIITGVIESSPCVLDILEATCSCKVQRGMKCPHVAALLYTIQQWPKTDEERAKILPGKPPELDLPKIVKLPLLK